MGLVLRRFAINLQATGKASEATCVHAQRAGISVIAMACFAECWSWTNLITGSDLFSTVEQALWSALFLVTGVGFVMMMLMTSWEKPPVAYKVFAALVIMMGLEQGYESAGLYYPRFLDEQRQGIQWQGFAEGLRT